MTIHGALALILVGDALAIGLMLFLRARSPEGGYFNDIQQAAGTFAVVGTAFAVLLAFVILLVFQSFDEARSNAEHEADATFSLFHVSEEFGPKSRDALQAELICYGRAVAKLEWPAMEHRKDSPVVSQRVESIEKRFHEARAVGPKADAAVSAWFDRTNDRSAARRGRLAEAQPFVPKLVWVVLLLSGAICVLFVCAFADRGERRAAQAALAFSVTSIVVGGLAIVQFLDDPYSERDGSVRPAGMEEILVSMERDYKQTTTAPIPCDERGEPRS